MLGDAALIPFTKLRIWTCIRGWGTANVRVFGTQSVLHRGDREKLASIRWAMHEGG